ncbi:MAG: hypothetical protein KDI44_09145 [Thiothrix sp.]|nr:hypothetical protein [Thiothrix sp.]HPQ94483.1 hypothetical protein [Thiolinea sp.]
MSESQCFILVEGINLYANIYDTDQLSVIRGSSFLYKDAIETLKDAFKGRMTCISSGASSGLFQPLAEQHAGPLVSAIEKFLAAPDCQYRLLTFMVVEAEATTLLEAKEKLYARLRLKQLQSLSLQPDRSAVEAGAFNSTPCGLSGNRIAAHHKRKIQGDKDKVLSDSVFQRWEYGRDAKKHYYAALLDDSGLKTQLEKSDFANDIETLCKDERQKLNQKMAVVYLDGNDFSTHQRNFIQSGNTVREQIERQQCFDTAIQQQRRQFLTETLQYLLPKQRGDVIRLETLLWGGDEMLLVMPAWEGFDFLQRFFAFGWQLPDGEGGADKPLTHAAGIVFCQANTPIRIIQKLARELAEDIKELKNGQGDPIGRQQNGWDYLVLESVDYPTNESLSGYFAERYGKTLADSRPGWLPAIDGWDRQRGELEALLTGKAVTRGQLHRIVQAIRRYPDPGKGEDDKACVAHAWVEVITLEGGVLAEAHPQEQAERRLFEVSEGQTFLKTLPDRARVWFGVESFDDPKQRAWFWIHLLELWDYLIPCQQPDGNEKPQEGQ